MVPLIGTAGGPTCMDEMDANVLLAFLEGLLRESEDGAKSLDALYAPPKPEAPRSRAEEIAAFMALQD